jgi:hypothetical protein
MLKIVITAIALLTSVASANAWYKTGRWMDTIHHLDLTKVPEVSEPIARLDYAKGVCHNKTKTIEDPQGSQDVPTSPAVEGRFYSCMRAQGFVFVPDSPPEIAAREKARQDAQMRETGRLIGNAMIDLGRQLQPHGCNGMVYPAGNFNMNCY